MKAKTNRLSRTEDWGGLVVRICCRCERLMDILSGDPPLCDCMWFQTQFMPNRRAREAAR